MNFHVDCTCGGGVTVTERSAGAQVPCACGRTVRVPSLHELRVSVGLPPYPISPELEIEHLLATDGFPRRGRCARCGTETNETIQVLVQIGEQRTGHSAGRRLVYFLLFGWLGLLFTRRGELTGYEKVYNVPLHVCPACQGGLGRDLRECLCKVDVYDRLLEKHPHAVVKRA